MNKSELINELAKALARAQASMGGAIKDASNPFFKSNYSTLESVWDACRKSLSENGISVAQPTKMTEKGVCVETIMMHESGQWLSGELTLRPTKEDAQGAGSAMSYARRYALAAMVGVYQVDDDGNAASAKGGEENKALPPSGEKKPHPNGEYIIKISGQYVGKKLKEVPVENLRKYQKMWQDHILQKKPVGGDVSEFLGKVVIYLDYVAGK